MSIQYDYAHSDAGAPAPGTTALLKSVLASFPGSRSLGIYSARTIRGSSAVSLHSEGRALDVRPASTAQGNAIRDWAYANRERYQIQEIIWQRKIWSSMNPTWRGYNGSNPHTDHLHIGQNHKGAGTVTEGPGPLAAGFSPLLSLVLLASVGYLIYQYAK